MAFEIQFKTNGVIVRWTEAISSELIQKANEEIWNRQDWPNFEFEIWDFSEVTSSDVSRKSAMDFAFLDNAATKSSKPHRKIAIVVSSHLKPNAINSYSETAEQLDFEMRVFGSLSEARAWLGVLS